MMPEIRIQVRKKRIHMLKAELKDISSDSHSHGSCESHCSDTDICSDINDK